MNLGLLYQLKNKSLWADLTFYVSIALLMAAFFGYSLFAYKYYLQNQKVNEVDQKIAAYGVPQQKEMEKITLDQKIAVDAFASLIGGRKIVSNVFAFIEQSILPDVWFSNFSLSEENGEIRLSGETKDMATLSRQIAVFEAESDMVKSVNVLNSQTAAGGKVKFIFILSLQPKIWR